MTGGDDVHDGTIEVDPPGQVVEVAPVPRVLQLAPAPVRQPPPTTSRAELVTTLVAAGSGAGFAVVSGNRAYLALAAVLLLATVGGSFGVRSAARRAERRDWSSRLDAHVAAVELVTAAAHTAGTAQRAALSRAHPLPDASFGGAERGLCVWGRGPDHVDFGTVRLGLGPVPALVTVEAATGSGQGPPGDPKLASLHAAAVGAHTMLEAAPVTVRLTGHECVAVVGEPDAVRTLVAGWVAQLAALHSPADLHIAAALSDPERIHWQWLKWLPHNAEDSGRPGAHRLVVVVGRPPATRTEGTTELVLCMSPAALPPRCSALVELGRDGIATYTEPGADAKVLEFVAEPCPTARVTALARWLAPRRVDNSAASADLGPAIRLGDLLPPVGAGAGAILQTPIGLLSDGTPLVLDLSESAAGGVGPHGILVGATGSGKSELMRSLVLGLSSGSSPASFATLLVDFKGGAAFRELAALPHCVGLVTNLADDLRQVDRVQAALVGEIVRRQQLLHDAGGLESIGAYQAGPQATERPLPYLLVVVDEFGELLEVRPDFLSTFTTIGRLGRSLGIHLLLASQRLDEGRLRGLESHLAYRIALRTFTAAESHAVIGSAAAAELPPVAGLGYLCASGRLLRFRAATTNLPARHVPGATVPSPIPGPALVRAFDLPGQPSAPTLRPETGDRPGLGDTASPGTRDLDLLVAAARELRGAEPAAPIWLPPLPDHLPRGALPGPGGLAEIALGLLDDPVRQTQPPWRLRLLGADAHVAIVGAPRSGRSSFLSTLVHTLAETEPPERLQVYALDLGGTLTSLTRLPHAGAVVGRSDGPGLRRVLAELAATLDDRSRTLRAAGCSTLADLDLRADREQWLPDPHRARILLLVDGLGHLRTDHPDAEVQLTDLAAAGPALGLHLAVSANRWTELRTSLLDSIGTRLELWLLDPTDSRHSRVVSALVPRVPGRGLAPDGRELQLVEPDDDRPVATGRFRAPGIAALPTWVDEADAPPSRGPGVLVLGVEEHRTAWVDLDLGSPGAHLLVFGDSGSGRTTMLRRLVRQLSTDPAQLRLHLVDPARGLVEVADARAVESYAYDRASTAALAARLDDALCRREPPPGLNPRELATGGWWTGPEHVLVVDDHDLLVGPSGSPLAALVDHVRAGRDRGFHVVLSRRVAGAARSAFEPFISAVRESAPVGLVLAGDRSEGPLVGDTSAQWQPPGRGLLVRPGHRPTLVQLVAPGRP